MGQSKHTAGQLRFQIGILDVENKVRAVDHEPMKVREDVTLNCWQLGLETVAENGKNAAFRRPYAGFEDVDGHAKERATLTAQYPIQNEGGFMIVIKIHFNPVINLSEVIKLQLTAGVSASGPDIEWRGQARVLDPYIRIGNRRIAGIGIHHHKLYRSGSR